MLFCFLEIQMVGHLRLRQLFLKQTFYTLDHLANQHHIMVVITCFVGIKFKPSSEFHTHILELSIHISIKSYWNSLENDTDSLLKMQCQVKYHRLDTTVRQQDIQSVFITLWKILNLLPLVFGKVIFYFRDKKISLIVHRTLPTFKNFSSLPSSTFTETFFKLTKLLK